MALGIGEAHRMSAKKIFFEKLFLCLGLAVLAWKSKKEVLGWTIIILIIPAVNCS